MRQGDRRTAEAQYHDPALAAFYDWDRPWGPDHDWFVSLVGTAGSVLDLGCGTGIFTAALATRGIEAFGVDPAGAMLDIARTREGGAQVRWVQSDAQVLALGQCFDAVVMIGHAFQTLLARSDRAAVLGVIKRHLAPGGRFFLDSRNPDAREWEAWRQADTLRILPHSEHGLVERWNAAREEAPGIIALETHYRLPNGRHLQALSRLAFPGFDELSGLILASGLQVDRWAGDASGGPLHPGCPDFIPIGRLAD